jgi:hypothetical protein
LPWYNTCKNYFFFFKRAVAQAQNPRGSQKPDIVLHYLQILQNTLLSSIRLGWANSMLTRHIIQIPYLPSLNLGWGLPLSTLVFLLHGSANDPSFPHGIGSFSCRSRPHLSGFTSMTVDNATRSASRTSTASNILRRNRWTVWTQLVKSQYMGASGLGMKIMTGAWSTFESTSRSVYFVPGFAIHSWQKLNLFHSLY